MAGAEVRRAVPVTAPGPKDKERHKAMRVQAIGTVLLRNVATCPGFCALIGFVIFGALAGTGMKYLPIEIEQGFNFLDESDVDSAILHSTFKMSTASNLQMGERFFGSSGTTLYRILDVTVAYELKDNGLADSILDHRALQEIATLERRLRSMPGWKTMCDRTEEEDRPLCDPGLSFVNYALATRNITRGEVLPRSLAPDGRSLELMPLSTVLHMIQKRELTRILLPRDFDPAGPAPTYVRSAFRFKLPCCTEPEGLRSLQAEWQRFYVEELSPTLRASWKDDKALLRVYVDGTGFAAFKYWAVLLKDVALAMGCLIYVFLYLVCHTRSILLSTVGLAVLTLSMPLSYVMFALISGSTSVSTFCLLSLFISSGLGADVILLYTGHWWDAAQHAKSDAGRLLWTYERASRVTLATSTTMALSFIANLASVFRPLREFGVLMGLCTLVTWLLTSLLYVPVCLVNDRHCAACRLYTQADGGGAKAVDATRCSERVCSSVVPAMRRWRGPLCILPALLGVAFLYFSLWRARLAGGVPELVAEGQARLLGDGLLERYAPLAEVFSRSFPAPPRAEAVCSEHQFYSSGQLQCSLFWCEAELGSNVAVNRSCSCFRRERRGCGADRHVVAIQRFAGLGSLSNDQLAAAVRDFLRSSSGEGVALRSGEQVGSLAFESVSPLLLQEWETGKYRFTPLTQVKSFLTRQNLLNSSCGWDDLCFCGMPTCRFPSSSWQLVPQQVRLGPLPPLSRSLQDYLWHVPPEERAVVDVVFGLKVRSRQLLLGRPELGASWGFLDNFDLRQPAAQRDLYAICADLPDDLLVVERRCWMEDFRRFLHEREERFPVAATRFSGLLLEFVRVGGMGSRGNERYLWFEGGELRATFVSFSVDLHRDVGASAAFQYKKRWDSYLQAIITVASHYTHGAFPTSQLWVQAEVQGALVSSTILTAVIIVMLGFVSTLVFTRSFALPFYVVFAALGAVSGLFFFMVMIMDWAIGPVEVVCTIVLLGYAFKCSLYVVYTYCSSEAIDMQPPESGDQDAHSTARAQRVGHALASAWASVLGGGAGLVGSALVLSLCRLTLFRRLGAALAVLALLSVLAALVPLPAGLLMCGPAFPGESRDFREQRKELVRVCSQLTVCLLRACNRRRASSTGGRESGGSCGPPAGDTAAPGWQEAPEAEQLPEVACAEGSHEPAPETRLAAPVLPRPSTQVEPE